MIPFSIIDRAPAHAPPEVKPLELRYVWVDPVGGEDAVLLLDLL